MSRPRIGVAGYTRSSDGQTRTGVGVSYINAVLVAGGLPIILAPELSPEETVDLFNACDGLLLTGGEDVEPARYGAKAHPKLGTTDPRRDANELALISDARARELPILAICRGIQVLNVAFGGTLVQDLPSQRPGKIDHDNHGARNSHAHSIIVNDGTRLAEILGTLRMNANSFHHQAVDQPGKGLLVTAKAPDGVIEGMESADPDEWIVAVQWHPEELAPDVEAPDLKLFQALIRAARRE